jgi:hypothetical protein
VGVCLTGGEIGEDMSKRSPIELVAAGGLLTVLLATGDAADEKSPKSPPKDSFRGAGGDVGFGGGVGFTSKKDPPLNAGFEVDGCFA